MHKTIINFCPTGMIPTKEITPYVPVSPAEIIDQTHEAFEAGITLVHLHARDEEGNPTYRSSIYRDIFEGIRKHCPDLVICGSSSGRNWSELEKRSELIELKPDMCSLTLSSLNFQKQASVNSPDMIMMLAEKMNRFGVIPELECFDMGMINYGLYLIRKKLIEGPYYWNLLFGNIAGFQPTLNQIGVALQEIPKNHFIGLAGIGPSQLLVNSIAIATGHGVRIGLEDNIWWDESKSRLASNIELIKRIHLLMEVHGSSLVTASDFRKLGFSNRKVGSEKLNSIINAK